MNDRQHATVRALVAGNTQREAAAIVGVCEQTVSGWMQDPSFRESLADARRAALEDAASAMLNLARVAVETLREVMQDANAPPAVRVRAATETLSRVGIPAASRTSVDLRGHPIGRAFSPAATPLIVRVTPDAATAILANDDP